MFSLYGKTDKEEGQRWKTVGIWRPGVGVGVVFEVGVGVGAL